MAVVRFNPATDLFNLQREMNKLFGDFAPRGRKHHEEFESAVWRPMVDIHEDEKSYVIDAELPGMKKEEVTINFQEGVLTISGERRYEREEPTGEENEGRAEGGEQKLNTSGKNASVHRMERLYGKFYRKFSFPTRVNPDGINARINDGILTVTVPKAEEVKPRQIQIS